MKTPDISKKGQIKLAFTRQEAAAALGVSPMTLDRWTRRRLICPIRANRRPLYALAESERFLNENRETASRTPRAKGNALSQP